MPYVDALPQDRRCADLHRRRRAPPPGPDPQIRTPARSVLGRVVRKRPRQGQFKAAFQNFDSTDAFEQQIELLLRQWLETQGLLGARITWPKERGSPFRGLAPFEAEHAAVFFGRDRVIDEARRRFVEAASAQPRFC